MVTTLKNDRLKLITGVLVAIAFVANSSVQMVFAANAPFDLNKSDLPAGRAYAIQVCSSCHDVSSRVDDEFAKTRPPSFYAVANAKTTSAVGLHAFLLTPHAPMPNYIIEDQDRRNVVAYIISLRAQKPAGL